MRLPRWSQIEDVINWYVELLNKDGVALLNEHELEEERQHSLRYDGRVDVPGVPVGTVYAGIEREAIDDARRGKFGPMAALLREENPLVPWLRVRGCDIGPEARTLIADRLVGKFKAPRRGNPGLREDQRLALSPVHAAARALPRIETLLRKDYPNSADADIADRAILIAEAMWKLDEKTLPNYLSRAKGDRRRLDQK